MQQRIVLRVLNSSSKKQSKAMQIVVAVQGVETVALQGQNKDQIMVIGEGIDAVHLISLLRKKLGFAELVSVVPIGELVTMEETTCETAMRPTIYPTYQTSMYPTYPATLPPYYVQHVGMNNQESCVIL